MTLGTGQRVDAARTARDTDTVTLRVGTRGSTLAITQSGHVAERLRELTGREVSLERIRTDGDVLTGPLAQMGGTGVFVTAIRAALLDGRVEVAVHSLKDLPTQGVDGLHVVTPPREDHRDALCARDGLDLAALPDGARVGTGSPRRAAQLLALRPDLTIVDIRGNIETRLARAQGPDADLDAVVLAAAGLRRTGRADVVTEFLDTPDVLPAPGQGALAVEVRTDVLADAGLATALEALDDRATKLAVTAERALLGTLEAGCAAPVGALGTLEGDTLHLASAVVRTDGTQRLARSASVTLPTDTTAHHTAAHDAAARLGADLARELLDAGAAELAELGPRG